MSYCPLPRSFGVETMADACFTLKCSNDPEHQKMADNPHSYGVEKMVATARAVARAKIEAMDAKRLDRAA